MLLLLLKILEHRVPEDTNKSLLVWIYVIKFSLVLKSFGGFILKYLLVKLNNVDVYVYVVVLVIEHKI